MAALIEIPTGVVDGVNVVFTVSVAYVPGSVSVFVRGLLRQQGEGDGWAETSPNAGTVTLAEAPFTGDPILIFFRDRQRGDTVLPLRGSVVLRPRITGVVRER